MNNLIKKQLEQCRVADLSRYDESTNTYFIPKFVETKVEVDKCYLIELDNVNMSSDSTISINFNSGRIPPSKYLKVDVVKVMNDLISVNAIGYDMANKQDTNDVWSGWLSFSHLKILEEL